MTDRYQRLRDALAAGPTPGPWRHEAWGSRILDSGVGSRQLLITTVAANTFRDQGRHNAEFIAAASPDTIAALLAEREALRKLVAAGCLLSSESEEIESDDGMGRCAGLDYWHEFEEKLAEARAAIGGGDDAPQD